MGHRKLKHVIGGDLYYNNKFEKEEHSYSRVFDSTYVNGTIRRESANVDTGVYVNTKNYDKIGFNLSYTLRYEASKRWVITASTIMTNKFYWSKTTGGRSRNYDMNFIGLVSDISIFYRF